MRSMMILGLGLMGAAGLTGCTDEGPAALGGDLLGEGFRTFEVVLDASEFLQADTTYGGLGSIRAAPFGLVAEAFEGDLYAHTLFRVTVPQQVTYENEDGETVTDSAFTILGGTVTMVLDSLRSDHGPAEFEVVELTESWEPTEVTWEVRSGEEGAGEPWAEPGGTTGRPLGSASVEALPPPDDESAGDTVRIELPDASVLADSANADRGALIRVATEGTRFRLQSVTFEFQLRPEGTELTEAGGSLRDLVVVVTPEPPPADPEELRAGGVPAWRSALQFRPLADLEIPCLPGSTTCTVRLADVAINQANLLLQPIPVFSRRIERPLRVEARAVLRAVGVPITRSPLSVSLGDMAAPMSPELFEPDAVDPERIMVPVTGYVRRNVDPQGDEDPILWVGLLARDEQQAPRFGFASFGSLASANPPQLRLVVTVPLEEESP